MPEPTDHIRAAADGLDEARANLDDGNLDIDDGPVEELGSTLRAVQSRRGQPGGG